MFVIMAVVLFGLFAAWRTVHSPFGRVLMAIRDNTPRPRSLGYPARRYKILAFVLSAFLAGLGGGLFAIGHGFVSLDTLHWTTSGKGVSSVRPPGVRPGRHRARRPTASRSPRARPGLWGTAAALVKRRTERRSLLDRPAQPVQPESEL